MNQRSLNIIPGSPLAQARLCQVKRRRANQHKTIGPRTQSKHHGLPFYTTGRNVPVFAHSDFWWEVRLRDFHGSEESHVTQNRNHSPLFRERAFTLTKSVTFLPAFKKNSLQVLIFRFQISLYLPVIASVNLLSNFRRNTGMWDEFTIFACNLNAAHMGDLLRTTRKLRKVPIKLLVLIR